MTNKLAAMKILFNLSEQLEDAGYLKQSNYVDQMLNKLAQETNLKPIGAPYQEAGKYYRKFEDTSKGTLVTREVTPEGEIIGSTPSSPTSGIPKEPLPESKVDLTKKPKPDDDSSWTAGVYNMFNDIASTIGGNSQPTPAPQSNPAKDSKSKHQGKKMDLDNPELARKYLAELKELHKKLRALGLELQDGELTELRIAPSSPTIIDEPTIRGGYHYSDEIPMPEPDPSEEVTELFQDPKLRALTEVDEKTTPSTRLPMPSKKHPQESKPIAKIPPRARPISSKEIVPDDDDDISEWLERIS